MALFPRDIEIAIHQVSKYKDDDNTFFLLPNIDYLVNETGVSRRTCERALQVLVKNGFISKSKLKCYDGAVRIKIFITNKFKQLMLSISNLVTNNKNSRDINETKNIEPIQPNQMAESDSVNLAESIIKEDEVLKDNNNINSIDNTIIKNVSFEFSMNNEKTYRLAEELADKYSLDCSDVLFALVDLQESGLYQNKENLIGDAIAVVKRNTQGIDVIPQGEVFNSYKAIEKAENERNQALTAKQQLAINQMLCYLSKKGKTVISNIKEVFSWIEFQVINPSHQFKGLSFKHCLNVIRNLLCNSSKLQYFRPIGFKTLSNRC